MGLIKPDDTSPNGEVVTPPKTFIPKVEGYKPRDFDKENRGKVKSLFIEALLSNPNVVVAISDVNKLNDAQFQATLDKLVESVF